MPSSETRLKSLQLTLSNHSSISLRSSAGHPPILQGCTYSGPSGNFLLERDGTTVKVEGEDVADWGSAFLTYFAGHSKKMLVLWVCMRPEAEAEIQFGIFDKDPKLDHGVLKKVTEGEIELETVGFGKDLLWKFQDDKGQMHEINIVIDIASTDHQFEAQLTIREPNKPSVDVSQPIDVLYKVTASVGGTVLFDRVHEDITISALISAGVDGFNNDTTYNSILGRFWWVNEPASWEFIRGVVWNDDPACDFFYNFEDNNGWFQGWGGWWSYNFITSGTLTYRSHHGDLQFLHAMASSVGELPEETQRKIMLWLEVMYRLSVGDGIQETDQINSTGLVEFFDDTTTPKGSQTLRALLVGTTPDTKATDIKRRALGSCFHLIQDSYAVGHCRRTIDNLHEMINAEVEHTLLEVIPPFPPIARRKTYIKGFPKDSPGRFSRIVTFHTYDGQDGVRHDYYDKIPYSQNLDPSDPASFYCIMGANESLIVCADLAQEWKSGSPWEGPGAVKELMETRFALEWNATPSDIQVDEHLW